MKKMLALFLAFALCVTLCACGTEDTYKPLLEHLEAQNYDGIKNELMSLSSGFKAEQEQNAETAKLLAKYQTLIDLLEAEDYEGALMEVESRIPVPECEVIEITMENWDEYFEIVSDYYWYENAFGEGEALTVGFSLFLKDVYASRLPDNTNSTIACTVSFDATEKTLDINWKEKTFVEVPYKRIIHGASSSGLDEGRWPTNSFEEGCRITSELNAYSLVPSDGNSHSNLFFFSKGQHDGDNLYNFYYSNNFSMVRIGGTLELLAK